MTERVPSPSFGLLLRRFRVAAGLSQEKLAEQAGLSARAVSDLERGENRTPRRDTLELLVAALNLSTEDRTAFEQTIHRIRTATQPSGDAASASGAPSVDRVDTLPAQPTAFIGREREMEAVQARLLDPDTRLLTLTGPGGVGKTRVALQMAATVRPAFADGVVFVPLASLADPALVLPTIAQVLGVPEAPGRAIDETLTAALRDKHLLLVLDNFEQVLDAANAVQTLVLAVPTLTVLVTSRAALRLRSERTHLVQPLAVPTPPLPALEELSQYEAVQLFIARAQDVQPAFAVTNASAPAVVEICARLDGLPLAIELAAARVRLLPPEALLARLGNRLKIVSGGTRDLPERQRTLRAVIDWSYNLLSVDEQVLFARSAVFVGGWTLEAMAAVCDAGGTLPIDVLDGTESLLDKNMLRRDEDSNGEPRYVMLETIHEFARERLAARGEGDALGRTHALHFLAIAEQADYYLRYRDVAWLNRLEADHNNLRAALRWFQVTDGDAAELRLAGALGHFWLVRGHWLEGQQHLREALAHASREATLVRACALEAAAFLTHRLANLSGARSFVEDALAIYRMLGNEQNLAHALSVLALLVQESDDYATAEQCYEEGLTISRRLNDQLTIANTLNNWGLMALRQGSFIKAMDLLGESVALYRVLNNKGYLAGALQNRAEAATHLGDYTAARGLLEESIELYHVENNEYELSWALTRRGFLMSRLGKPDIALMDLQRALRGTHKADDKYGIIETTALVAGVIQALGELERAVYLYGAVEALSGRLGVIRDPNLQAISNDVITGLRMRLTPEVYSTAWVGGQCLSIEQVITEALAQ